jgi:hypothetical protein
MRHEQEQSVPMPARGRRGMGITRRAREALGHDQEPNDFARLTMGARTALQLAQEEAELRPQLPRNRAPAAWPLIRVEDSVAARVLARVWRDS